MKFEEIKKLIEDNEEEFTDAIEPTQSFVFDGVEFVYKTWQGTESLCGWHVYKVFNYYIGFYEDEDSWGGEGIDPKPKLMQRVDVPTWKPV